MKRYLTFLYEPGSGQVVEGSVARQPDPRQPEGTQWKVIRNVGRVQVIAQVDDQTTEIATAKWRDDLLSDFEQEGTRPTPEQWRAVELALQANTKPDPGAAKVVPLPVPEPPPAADGAKRYLTFLLDLQSPADNKAIAQSVRYEPDRTAVPRPFVWKIIRDADDRVLVHAHGTGWARPIATARWNAAGIHDQRQQDPSEPNGNQWKWIGRALAIEGATPEALRSSCDSVEEAPRLRHEPAVPESDQATRASPSSAVSNKHAAREFLTYMAVLGVAVLAIVGLKRACVGSTKKDPPSPPPVVAEKQVAPIPPAPEPTPAPVPEPPVEARVAQATSLADAIALARPAMIDSAEDGAVLLARYGKLRWSDVETPETTVAKVQKDPEAERGKRVCGEGEIERITRRDVDRKKAFVGRLAIADGDALAFVAIGTTGELVKRDRAKLCGVVTGMSGTDVAVLGMFDLPENRMPQVEQ